MECFLEQHQSSVRPLWGGVRPVHPTPLGPLYDIARQAPVPLRTLLDGETNRATLFAAVLDELAPGPLPTIVVIEDIHWADEATLDLIKFLARRIHRTQRPPRPDLPRRRARARSHPLRLVLGDLPARDVTRLWLPPLSEVAVATLAQQANRPAKQLHAITSGNPFFLTEVLASDTPGVPTSVSDAVLAQIARRSPEAQRLLEVVAVVPTKVAWRTVEAVGGASSAGLEECLAAGLLQVEGRDDRVSA